MKTLTLLNEKGGVGKTTLSVHVAAGLAHYGYRTMLVDADPQANATFFLGYKPQPAFHDLIVRNAAFKDSVKLVTPEIYEPPNDPARGRLYLVPSDVETRNIASTISDPYRIADRFRQLESTLDVVVFDTSPTPSLLHGAIYIATDAILYPTECEMMSFQGLVSSLQHREGADRSRLSVGLPGIDILGIIPTKYRGKTFEHRDNLATLRERYGDLVWDPLSLRTVWTEAATARRTVFAYAPNSRAAADAWQMVERVIEALQHEPS